MMKIDPRMKEILGVNQVNQVGIVVKDIEKAMENYADYFGITFPKVFIPEYFNKVYRGEPSDFRMKIAVGMMGSLQIELIQVLQGKTVYEEFLDRNGDGLHHLGFYVKNMEERVEALSKMGIAVLMKGERVGARFVYMDTEPIVGVIFEFIEKETWP
jgi:methylmalonyl-CoA/ethylmalonyl-CoA epimerase